MSEQVPGNEIQTNDIDGFELLNNIKSIFLKYFVLSEAQAIAITLWSIHTYIFQQMDVTPYLHITSAEKRCGKSILLELISLLVLNPWLTSKVTAAVIARRIDMQQPTLLLDESDAAFRYSTEYSETLRGILNSGYRHGGKTSVCVGQGENIGYRDFSTFCPKAIAGIGQLPDTIADRSIPIVLKRKSSTEHVERFRSRKVAAEAKPLKEEIERLAPLLQLQDAEPEIPEELDDRAADIWEPLFAIADAVGHAWPQMARDAALELSSHVVRDDQSIGIRLLTDIKSIFDARAATRISSTNLVHVLKQMEEYPWAEFNRTGITPVRMAQILRPYGIAPRTIRIGEITSKGYYREQFTDAWNRYVVS